MVKQKLGIYAGTFNPYHIGHEDVYQQACKVFDEVIIAQGINTAKKKGNNFIGKPSFTKMVKERGVLHYNHLLSSLFDPNPDIEKFLIRGLRTSFDVGYEDNLRNTLLDFNPDIKVIYFFCHKEHEHVSSSMIRSLYPFGEDAYSRYLV